MKTKAQLEDMTVPELKAYSHKIKFDVKGQHTKPELVKEILAFQKGNQFDPENGTRAQPDLNQHPSVELQSSTVVPEKLTLPGGDVVERGDITQAAFRDSGLTPEKWNKLEEDKRNEKLEDFMETIQPQPIEPVQAKDKQTKVGETERKAQIKALLKPYTDRGLGLELEENYWVMNYRGREVSGNIYLDDNQLQRQAGYLVNRQVA